MRLIFPNRSLAETGETTKEIETTENFLLCCLCSLLFHSCGECKLSVFAKWTDTVGIVPVRMTEAWLLFDERAIRAAADNPNGTDPLPALPTNAEAFANPKEVLHEALRVASGLSGRRRKKLRLGMMVHRVADYIEDFSPLRSLPAFGKFEDRLESVCKQHGWS